MDCDEGPGAHLTCAKGEPKGTWEDSWRALESLVGKSEFMIAGPNFLFTFPWLFPEIFLHFSKIRFHQNIIMRAPYPVCIEIYIFFLAVQIKFGALVSVTSK